MASEASALVPVNPLVTKLSGYIPLPVDWLWQPYLPTAMLTMLSGDPGAGKTYLALAIAAALTTGRTPGTALDSAPVAEPVDVLYLTVENSVHHVLRPRFDLLGGDPERLHLLTTVTKEEECGGYEEPIRLDNTTALTKALDETRARLVVVDPLQSFLGPGINVRHGGQTRPILDRLCELAEAHDCAILLIRHLSKARTGRALARGLGSIDLTGAVRSELLAGNNGEECALIPVKSNVAPLGPALGYHIDPDGAFAWMGTSELTAAELLSSRSLETDTPKGAAAAETFFREFFQNHSRRPASKALEEAKAVGIAPRTLYRVKARLNVGSSHEFDQPGQLAWYWQRPAAWDPPAGS